LSLLKKKKIFSSIKVLMPILLLLLIGYEARGLFKEFDWDIINMYLDRLPAFKIVLIFILGLISLIPMFYYDLILTKIFSIHIKRRNLIIYSFSANAFSNLVGFGGVAGTTLRSLYFRKYVQDDVPYILMIAKLSLFYLTGLSFLSWLVVFSDLHVYSEIRFLKLAVWAVAAYTPLLILIYMFQRKFWEMEQVKKAFVSELMTISIFEWLFVVICIWGIARFLSVPISFSVLFPIVVISACVGIISLIPGGIGSFDLVFLIGMGTHGIPTELSLLIIMFYRLSYYIFPALIAAPFVIYQFTHKR
jgi:glycosyltransferase 2 family protein